MQNPTNLDKLRVTRNYHLSEIVEMNNLMSGPNILKAESK